MSQPHTDHDKTAKIVAELLHDLHGADDVDGYEDLAEVTQAEPRPKQRSLRDAERLAQGLGAVYSPRRAAELLPGDDKRNRAWLRQQGLVHRTEVGKEVVIWAEVVDVLKAAPSIGANARTTARRRRRSADSLPRFDLGA